MNATPHKPSILLVDDDSMLRDTLKIILRGDDYEIAGEASNGEAALAACRQYRPGVVLLDINMPGMGGLEVLHAIRKDYPATKVIMVSAEATLDRVQEAIAGGAVGFIVKPFNAGRVLDDVNEALEKEG